ncbi:pyridoxal-phosphate dependent enzyme [Fimbriimonas ginsengisoli Gsoil 348]|uniref:Pyridoxal-phosphate dependent enzyme n=1 Tax=Fimbriimonas ginsengisoli Gsoil 348 TaxID=661478 RepID=A0A068NXA3_FIMGI|nr:pyridoxal-phosphate dependent enzyme [Fimbriimonas ginsengisoli Gsoil 348]
MILSPTPLHRLDRMSEELGLDLWIKRDDLTGFAFGGNKGRKLEYLMADVLDQDADVVVSCGSTQSNFIRQLGAACSRFHKVCAAATMALPYEDIPPPADAVKAEGGNVILDRLLGIDLRVHPNGTWEELYELAEELAREYEASGKRVYRIPIGGSSPLGAYAFYQAAIEVEKQAPAFDQIVFASSSGSTHTGLAYRHFGSATEVIGIACDPEPEIAEDFARLAGGVDDLAGQGVRLAAKDFHLDFRFVGAGYGVPSEAGEAAIRRLAQAEGIFLDPIYSGKAFAGLIQLAEEKRVGGRVLFWHTGGTPALFA